ncbi:immune-associated nucleotide-binding protein 9-like isoform X2 [Coffea arabica]|uniref:Immune-associated nucleotide-binding protein 9-like isoform X2 n=1 Tax=Coffea arabica TaxID=13443 RepID=A0A6P6UMC8_COFAR|nr:immune-associated nucleotide-binding protein 9-like isoform X2 [Coffea arabica]
MGGSFIDDDWESGSASHRARTVVLVGRTGDGKSATGNSILGRKAFKSMNSPDGITSTSELQTAVLEDGQIINVIDTPGLFNKSAEPQLVGKEIVRCIDMAKDGIHAVLVVVSLSSRISLEEAATVETLQKLFGDKITKYMIMVFTGGDDFEEDEVNFDDYLSRSESIKKAAAKLRDQAKELNSLEGYSKEEKIEREVQIYQSYEEHLARSTDMVETKLREATHELEQQLAEEQDARLKAEQTVRETLAKSDNEICKLRQNLETSQRLAEQLKKFGKNLGCHIM